MTPWPRLPRDTVQTLWMLVMLALVIAPHWGRLPWWCVAVSGLALMWRGALAWTQKALPARPVLLGLLGMAFGLTWLAHHTFLTKDAGVTLAVLLVAVKTLESRSWRDTFVVFLVGIFLVLTQFLYSQSLPMVLGMVAAVWGLTTLLVLTQARGQALPTRHAAALVARMALWGAPFMVALFVLFPRIEPLWGVAQAAGSGTGLTDRIQLGSVSALASDESIAMRVRFKQGVPAAKSLYFRGLVLSDFDGTQWRARTRYHMVEPGQTQPSASTRDEVTYQFTLEPQSLNFIPVLETTTELAPEGRVDVRLWSGWIWKTADALAHAQTFQAHADLGLRRGPFEPAPELRLDLRVPEGFNPRLHAYAQSLLQNPAYAQADAPTWVTLLMTHIRSQGYRYTLTPGTYGDANGRGALDEFWFDRRAGFCEHFASAFAVLLRELGVPARLVLGFQGAEYNSAGGYHVVRNNQAHAWVEYWQPEIGWTRLDPTTAIPTEQIAAEPQLRPPPGVFTSSSIEAQTTLARTLRHRWEAITYAWNDGVLNYSSANQMSLLGWLGFEVPSMAELVWVLCAVLVGVLLLFLMGASRPLATRQDPWLHTYRDMQQQLAQAGLGAASPDALGAHVPPGTLAQLVHAHWGSQGESLCDVLREMQALRYARTADAASAPSQAARLKALRQRLRQAAQALKRN